MVLKESGKSKHSHSNYCMMKLKSVLVIIVSLILFPSFQSSDPTNPQKTRIEYDYPSWSPTEDLIAFHMDNGDGRNIYLINANGTNMKQLTFSKGDNAAPFWSPDGTKIGFHSKRDGDWDLFIMNKDGSDVKRITDSQGDDYFPASWSPNGNEVVFMSNRDGDFDVYRIDINTQKTVQLTNDPGIDGVPSWSNDGQSILFHSTRHEGYNFQVYQMDVSGKNVERLVTSRLHSFMAQESPVNGNLVIYLSGDVKNKYDNWEIMLLDRSSGEHKNLTNHASYDFKPSWSPDGKQIVFTSRREGVNHLYIMTLENQRVRKII